MKFALKVSITIILIFTLSIALISFFAYFSLSNNFKKEIKNNLLGDAIHLMEVIEEKLPQKKIVYEHEITNLPLKDLELANIFQKHLKEYSGQEEGSYDIDIIDRNGIIAFSSNQSKIFFKEKISNLDKLKEEMNGKKSGFLNFYQDNNHVGAFVREENYSNADTNGWTLIIYSLKKELFSSVYTLRFYLIIMFIVILLIIVLSTPLLIREFAKPIKEFLNATGEIEKGNFKIRVDIESKDEFEDLGKAFNKMTEQLDRTNEDRKQIDKMKTEFMSITSHELRSPMTPMRAQLQMLLQGYFGKISKKQKYSIDLVSRNTERLDNIILDFLEISRIEAGRLKFNFIKTSLESYIMRLIDEMKGFLPEKKIKLITDITKLPIIEVDPDRVMQVLRNLVNNAIKFSKDKGRIWIKAGVLADRILFMVKDEGEGIKKDEQIRIFEPFFQAGGMYERKVGGTGLGLAICKGIVESQHGRIWFESEEGKGTTFYFTIPLVPEKEIAPIKLLFSHKSMLEPKMKELFVKYLGPIGAIEFDDLRLKGLDRKKLSSYIKELHANKIIDKDKSRMFYASLETLFSYNKIKVVEAIDLKKLGFVKEGGTERKLKEYSKKKVINRLIDEVKKQQT